MDCQERRPVLYECHAAPRSNEKLGNSSKKRAEIAMHARGINQNSGTVRSHVRRRPCMPWRNVAGKPVQIMKIGRSESTYTATRVPDMLVRPSSGLTKSTMRLMKRRKCDRSLVPVFYDRT